MRKPVGRSRLLGLLPFGSLARGAEINDLGHARPPSLLPEAVKLSIGTRHTLHDCLYLAAARQLGAALITADRPFWKKVSPSYMQLALLPGCETN